MVSASDRLGHDAWGGRDGGTMASCALSTFVKVERAVQTLREAAPDDVDLDETAVHELLDRAESAQLEPAQWIQALRSRVSG